MAATRIEKGFHHFGVASGPFNFHIKIFSMSERYFQEILLDLEIKWKSLCSLLSVVIGYFSVNN